MKRRCARVVPIRPARQPSPTIRQRVAAFLDQAEIEPCIAPASSAPKIGRGFAWRTDGIAVRWRG